MKRILISAVLALALAGTSAFAAQNKNAPAKKPAAKPAAAATDTGAKKPGGKKHHRRKKKKASSNTGGSMTGTAKKGNTNKK